MKQLRYLHLLSLASVLYHLSSYAKKRCRCRQMGFRRLAPSLLKQYAQFHILSLLTRLRRPIV